MSKNITIAAERRSYEIAAHLVAALACHCAGAPNKVIDLLTGYLWDEQEAVRLKALTAD